MPMSDVPGVATKAEWDAVYEHLFAPAIKAAGFLPVRSRPTIGNLVKGIINDLWSADAVLADLTGQKANVFYELGVRHALRGRTIIIARDKKDIPFDLQSYAWHTYDPTTRKTRCRFREAIGGLLAFSLQHRDEPDNPVSDFLNLSQRIHRPLDLFNLALPQQKACGEQLRGCEQALDEIARGQVPVPGGTAEYFSYFIDLINAGTGCESVKVFLSKMDDNSLRYNKVTAKALFAPFKRAVVRRRMRIEYTCLFASQRHYEKVKGWEMLNRHREFAYCVRRVFKEEIQFQAIPTDKTFVLFENRKWVITHSWNKDGIIEKPILSTNPSDFHLLHERYKTIRSHSHPYKGRRSSR
jgi:hypothetical protein